MALDQFSANPLDLFNDWFQEAARLEINDPNAMSLATVDETGRPSLRMVLLKGIEDGQFVFYTNRESRKGIDIAVNPHVALCFYWKSTHKQVRIEGIATSVSDEEADIYFASRPVGAQMGAWASKQSRPLESRDALEKNLAHYALKFGNNPVPRPPYWSGFRVMPQSIEFWEEKPFRLHHRLLYQKNNDQWEKSYLYP